VEIGHIGGGPEALAELRHLSHHPELPKPSVILVDLNMPAVDGLEVIAYVKSHEALRDIKTVVLSTSNSASDRLLSRNAGADGYLVKPDAFSEWCELMERVAEEHRVPGPGA
jgi:CheY-like chemotaxis protein